MAIAVLVIIGAAAGFLATRLMKVEADIITTVALGMAGALVGGLVMRLLLNIMGFMAGFVGALMGAMLLVWIWKTYFRR